MAESPETLAFRVWIRRWSQGYHDCTMQVLDNAALFPKCERSIIDAVNAVIPKGGQFEDTVERLRELGEDDVALELEELALSTGSSNPATFRRYFEKVRKPYVAEELRKLVEKLATNGTSLGMAQARIAELFRFEHEVRDQAPDLGEILVVGDPENVPAYDPPEWICAGLLRTGTTTLIGPPKKGRKTLFAVALALSLETGTPFLGRKVSRRHVGIVNHDMPRGQYVEYVGMLQRGHGMPVCQMPYRDGTSHPGFDLLRPEAQRSLCDWVQKTGINTIVIDALGAVAPTVNRKNDEENMPLMRGFLNGVLRDQLNLSVIVLSHTAKAGGDTMIGGIDQTAAVDSKLFFKPGKDAVTIYGEGRHPDFELSFRVDDLTAHDGGLVVRHADGPGRPTNEELAMRFLAQSGDWRSTSEVAQAVGRKYELTRTALARCLADGKVETRPTPGRKGQQWRLSDRSDSRVG